MSATSHDVARLQPTSNSLNVILKNTFFKDSILDAGLKIHFRIDYVINLPVIIFKFSEPYYDFLEVLKYETLAGSNYEWLNHSNIVIKLVISDSVVTDKLMTREFVLGVSESDHLKKQLHLQEHLTPAQVKDMEDHVYGNLNDFLK